MGRTFINNTVSLVVVISCLIAGCGRGRSTVEATPTIETTAVSSVPRQLTICLGQEPVSLYPFGNVSTAARSILSAIYDGPIDNTSYGYQPIILTKLPTLSDGDAEISAVAVYVGDEVINADGQPITLVPNTRLRPAGCRSDSCAVTYDGIGEILMDQMIVTFNIKPGLKWSDGKPLTAADSVYSFTLASDPKTPGSKYLVDRTKAYDAADDVTVQWWGKPGFIDPTYFTNFWTPYPKHVWEEFPADQLTDADVSARTPVGWGPYRVKSWDTGEQITLERNPFYFRSDEGLPVFDALIFRFTPDPGTAIGDLLSGNCDLIDPGVHLEGQVELLQSLESQGKVHLEVATTPVMEQLVFGIKPASYDSGYTSGVDRADFFSDKRMRQALAMCLDRQKVVDDVLFGLTSVPVSYLPAEHPLYVSGLNEISFDPAAGNQLLESLGWQDLDGNPSTPRQARGISGILGGTSLEFSYVTTGAAQRQQVAQILSESLAQCGIKVNIRYMDTETLFSPGPDGILFGRQFDLAEFAIGSTSQETSCAWYTTAEIPNSANRWIGVNISGYSNLTFDAACQDAQQSTTDDSSYTAAFRNTQTIFVEDLPTLPLYWRLRVAAVRPDFCNFKVDPTASSSLWNIEEYDTGEGCIP